MLDMDLLNQFAINQNIQIKNILNDTVASDNNHLVAIHDEFLNVVTDIQRIIEHLTAPIIHIGFSNGKDSTLCLIATLEAYKRSIASGAIEADRLLLVSTIDTLIEALPMQFLVNYSKKYIADFAQKNNINMVHSITSPTLSNEYFIKYAGADKLINNPSRTGDCTNILKIDPAMRVLAKQKKTILNGKRVVSFTGSRNEESPRRLMNMRKQGVGNKAVDDVLADILLAADKSDIQFAPIRDWATEDVFDFLRIAGDDSLYSIRDQREPIKTYFSDFALLLELYGKASNEACSIVVNASGKTESSGCGGSSERYGCNFCTRIVFDKSSTSISKKPYWDYLGTTDALRVRDWISRTASNPDARTMHPKSVDPVFNRIMFQSNVLKSKYLEKMVKYASQLTVNSELKAKEFDDLIRQGRENEHEGYKSIIEDKNIHPKAKQQLLEMYKEGARKPYMPYFSVKHAVLLSLKWSMLGVSSAPYRPLKIWDDATKGKSVIPFPKLNSELPKSDWEMKSTPMIDPIVLRLHTKSFEAKFFEEGSSFLSYWEKPFSALDMFDHSNCQKIDNPIGTYLIKSFFDHEYTVNKGEISLTINIKKVNDAKTGRALNFSDDWVVKREIETLLQNKIFLFLKEEYNINNYSDLVFNSDEEAYAAVAKINELTKDIDSGNMSICYLNKKSIFSGFKKEEIKSTAKRNATERVRLKSKPGTVIKTSTRCKFYTPTVTPNLEVKTSNFINMAIVDFNTQSESTIGVRGYMDDVISEIEPIMFDELAHFDWLDYGFYDKAIEIHDQFIESSIKNRRRDGHGVNLVRRYTGYEPVSRLMNESGMMIEASYRKQFEKTLKRTHLLDECGAFDLQALSFDELTAHPSTISMTQHRSDKAEYLLKVRAEKNIRRRALKKSMAKSENDLPSFAVDVATKLVTNLFSNAISYVNNLKFISIDDNGKVSGQGVDCEVSLKNQAKTYLTWFNFYGAAISNYTSFKKVFLTSEYNAVLSENRFKDLELSRLYNDLQVKLSEVTKTCSHNLTIDLSSLDQKIIEKKIVSNMSTSDKVSAMSKMLMKIKKAA